MKNINTEIKIKFKNASSSFKGRDIFDLAFHFCDEQFNADTVSSDYDSDSIILLVDMAQHINATKFKTAMNLCDSLNLLAVEREPENRPES